MDCSVVCEVLILNMAGFIYIFFNFMNIINVCCNFNGTFYVIFYFQIKRFENVELDEERIQLGKEVYDNFIMKELLSQSHVSIYIEIKT